MTPRGAFRPLHDIAPSAAHRMRPAAEVPGDGRPSGATPRQAAAGGRLAGRRFAEEV